MDSFEINKIIAAIILVVVITVGVDKISDNIFHINKPAKLGYKVDVVATSASSASSTVEKNWRLFIYTIQQKFNQSSWNRQSNSTWRLFMY